MSQNDELLSPALSSTKRLFFALWLDDDVIQKIEKITLKHFKGCQGRILDKSNWHITLAYFGSADNATQACLEEQVEKINSQPFELKLSQCGFWPRPKVAWIAPEKIPDTLMRLATDLQQAIKPCGFEPETREYQPHITLVRKAKHPPLVKNVQSIKLKVEEFCLVESKTTAEGAEYTVLKRWHL